ncbi:ribosome biogenesis protein TSR1 [Vairimorpha necatrix]|uniref:Ribosome biogenesis protein TSR1 n=1 Tax=Vairimorpha necatrix TaxID=6039 RepID=A0AAX4JGL1_9MICR
MKIKDKRNRNKMKNDHKQEIKQKSTDIYKSEHGPYKIVSFVDLGGDMTKIKEEFLDNQSTNMYYNKQKKQNFMFIDTTNFSDIETSYITRTSDIVVCVVNTGKICEKTLLLVKRHLPTCLFVVLNKKFLNGCKKFVAKFLPEQKIVELKNLLDFLCILKINPSKISSRPFMVPFSVSKESENLFTVKGFMKKGPVSDKVTINGKYNGEIVEIKGDRIYKGQELGMSDENKSEFVTVQDFQDNEMEIEDYDESDFEPESEINEDENEEDYEDYSQEKEEYPSLIDKYSEYKGIRNISTCDLPTDKYPEYYKNLLFFQDFKHVKKMITKRQSVIPDNQFLEIVIRVTENISDNIFVMFGHYEFEEFNTVHNYSFQGAELKTGEKIFVDMGHKILEVTPTITKSNNQNLYKREELLDTGVITFIAPLAFDIHKILVFYHNPLREISRETFLLMAVHLEIKDRKLYDEVVLKGLPIKIHKRSCTVKRMFYSKEEVLYYKDIKLYTKNGRSHGFIKKPLGVHGAFKAYFSHPIASNDKIFMSLYKRAFLEDFSNK